MKNGKITEMLGIKEPIFQGGMAWIADAELAAAVSNAGGLGIIAAGNADADYVTTQIRKAKELTDKPFGLNIMLLSPFADEVAQAAADESTFLLNFCRQITTGGPCLLFFGSLPQIRSRIFESRSSAAVSVSFFFAK